MRLARFRPMLPLLLALLLARPVAAAQLETYAGGSIGDGLPATQAPVQPIGVVVDGDGNVYVSDEATSRVRRVDAHTGVISTIVGGTYGWCGYVGPGADICLAEPRGLSIDGAGGLLLSEATGVVRRWDPVSTAVTHVAGRSLYDPTPCQTGDGIAATDACLSEVEDVATDDSTGAAFILGGAGHRVFRVDTHTGKIARYAGCDLQTDVQSGENGPALGACLGHAEGIAVDHHGNVLVAALFDQGRIWQIDAATKHIVRLVGGGQLPACLADDIPAAQACLTPRDVTVDADGNLFTVGFQGSGIRRIDAVSHSLTHVVPGAGEWQVTAAPDGRLYAAAPTQVLRIDPVSGTVEAVAGNGSTTFCGDGVPATSACLGLVADLTADGAGNVLLVDPSDAGRLRRVDAATRIITTVATGGVCDDPIDVDPSQVCFTDAVHVAATSEGRFYVADTHGNDDDGFRQLVRQIDLATGALTTVAGHCTRPESAAIPALDACIRLTDLAGEPNGDLLLAEGSRVRRIVAQTGQIEIVAGNGDDSCTAGDPSGPALAACLHAHHVAVGGDGTVFIVSRAASGNDVIARLDQSGDLVPVAGQSGASCSPVSNGQSALAGCLQVQSVVADAHRNLFVGSRGVVRLIEAASGIVTTLGGRPPDPSGFDPCCEACTNPPECLRATDLALDPAGRVLTAEPDKRLVRRMTLTCGNGVVDPGEECDDGNLVSGDGCDTTCRPSRCAHPLAPTSCAGQPVPQSIARALQRSCTLAARRGALHDPVRVGRLERSIAKTLRVALRPVRKLARRGVLTPACAGDLSAGLQP